MQAIQTKYLPATNTKGSRIKAWCERGSITVPYDSGFCEYEAHESAVAALRGKFAKEDEKAYGTPLQDNPWCRPVIGGGLPGGGYAFVFLPR